MSASDQFNIRWNNYTTVLQSVFRRLLDGEQFVDVTLACEGQSIKCHRVILSACSTYFDRILTDNQSANLVIYLKDMKFWELRALVTFMYNGEVSISQQKLPLLCKAAEALKVKGLAHDTTLGEGGLDQLEEDEMDDYSGKEVQQPVTQQRQVPQKSLLRQHNNLQQFAASQQRHSFPQVKRKIMTQPPKLVKMQRVERPTNGAVGGVLKSGQALPVNKVVVKKEDVNRPSSSEVNDHEEDLGNEQVADSSMREEVDGTGDGEEHDEMDGGDENDSMGSEGDDSQQGQATRPNKIAMKYGKEVRDSALSALQSGMSLRQCSETYGVPKKTLSKWKSREMKQEGEEDSQSPTRKEGPVVVTSGSIVLPPKTTMGAPVDAKDRADRLMKATELALSGVTVRQAAAHFEIPRTTLCAYMKRRGLAAKRNFLPNNSGTSNLPTMKRTPSKADTSSADTNGQGNSSHYEDFPFLGLSELMDEVGQGNYDADGYAEGEEEYSEK